MGAINNAFNQALGAAAGAGLAIKHAKESDFSKAITAEHSALIANNQAVDAEAAGKAAYNEQDKTLNEWMTAVSDRLAKEEAYNKVEGDKNVSEKIKLKKYTELEASKRAMDSLSDKMDGLQAIIQRAKDQRAYADKASQIASKAQQRYQSRWGGK